MMSPLAPSRVPRLLIAALMATAMASLALSAHAQYGPRYEGHGRAPPRYEQPRQPHYSRDQHWRQPDYYRGGHESDHGDLILGALVGGIIGMGILGAMQAPPPVVYPSAPPPPPPGVYYSAPPPPPGAPYYPNTYPPAY